MVPAINPDMIALARESRGLSQRDLAKQLDVTQGLISKIETGHLSVSQDMLDALVSALKYPEKFFHRTFQVYPPGMHFYRQHKTLSARKAQEILAKMNVRRAHVKVLLDAAEIDYKPLPECDIEQYGSPEEVARTARHYFRLPRGPIQNLTELLEDAGILIIHCDVGTRMFAGASMFAEKPNYIICVNKDMPGDRLRYTLAHELGHMIMHKLPTPSMEEEADRFASEFLIPARDIGQYLSNIALDSLANLKQYWKVSMAAILRQALRLRKITDRRYSYLWTQMGAAGYRLREPPELDIPVEKPTLLAELIDLHIKELGYSEEQLSDMLACDVDEFIELYMPQNRRLKLIRKVG